MTAHDDQGSVVGELGEILLDEPVLQPVLADTAGLSIGDEFVGVQGDVEVQVVVDLYLEGFALGAATFVLIDWASLDVPSRTPPVGVDAAICAQFLEELRGGLLVQFWGQVAQSIA